MSVFSTKGFGEGKPSYFNMSINQRSKFLNTSEWKKVLTQQDQIDITKSIQSPFTKYDEDVDTFGMINGMMIASYSPNINKSLSTSRVTRGVSKVSQYNYGIQ